MTTTVISEKLKAQAKDLTREFPRSPRETLAGYVIAARLLDKCRATLADIEGEYKFNGFMDNNFFSFTEIDPQAFQDFVATGATDEEVADWITAHAKPRERIEIVRWNNQARYKSVKDMPERFQGFMELYIEKHVPKHRPVIHVFDIFDLEEKRL